MTESADKRNGIVLAMFGTSVEHALPGLLNIAGRMAERYPKTVVRIAFTSKIIRRIWQDRAADPSYRGAHPEVPDSILQVQSPQKVIDNLREQGIDSLVIQQVQIAPVRDDAGQRLFNIRYDTYAATTEKEGKPSTGRIALGRPALGNYGTAYPGGEDIASVVRSLSQDAALARQENAALFYMGHGNKKCSTGKVYSGLVEEMRRQYPDVCTVMSLVEERPTIDETIVELKEQNVETVLLKPFMIVAGDHVRKDMVSDGAGSMKTLLEGEGFTVVPVFRGLGEENGFADIFVQHAADAASDADIELR